MSGKRTMEKHRKNKAQKHKSTPTPTGKMVRVPDYYFCDDYYGGSYTRTILSERLAGALVLE